MGVRIVEVERYRALPTALDQRPEGSVPAGRAAPLPERIATLRMFDLDDVSPVIGEQAPGEGASNQRSELKDPKTSHGSSHARGGAGPALIHLLPHIGLIDLNNRTIWSARSRCQDYRLDAPSASDDERARQSSPS